MDPEQAVPWPTELTFSGAILKNRPEVHITEGEPSTEETVEHLRAMAEALSTRYLQENNLQPEQFELNAGSVQSVADFIDGVAPFYNHGTGISTLPEQLRVLEQFQHSTRLPGEEEHARAGLRLQLDCKLATVLCGMVIESLCAKANRAATVNLITYRNSHHPSVLVESGETRAKIDYKTADTTVPATLLEMDIPMPHRLTSISFAYTRTLTPEEAGKYAQPPYNVFGLGLEGMQTIDTNFLDS